ncbi:MAG TPA: chemotaxis-specific protein-glutamate methyltransferase CheB [Abditibacterium sp.]
MFLVDDSPLALVLLKRILATSPAIEVVGTARNGREALAAFERTRPDVICTDYQMPEMDGLELIKHTMATFPRPILVISSIIDPGQREQVFPLLAAGAVDVVAKPSAIDSLEQSAILLVQKIKLLSGVVVISRRLSTSENSASVRVAYSPGAAPRTGSARESASPPPLATRAPQNIETKRSGAPPASGHSQPVSKPEINGAPVALRPYQANPVRLVAIGASTGGPQALQTLLSRLPPNISCPILCVQHISTGFLQGLVEWLNNTCPIRVKIADDGEQALAGTVYFPPEDRHLEIDHRGQITLSHAPPLGGHRPAVCVTFHAVARAYGNNAVAVLLTGMGSDGASGMESVILAGGATLAQDEASCIVFGMPKQAILRGAAHFVMSPEKIAEKIARMAGSNPE